MHVCIYVRTYICMYVCTYVCMFVRMYIHTYVCMYVCVVTTYHYNLITMIYVISCYYLQINTKYAYLTHYFKIKDGLC